jgi:predicted nucleic acid-binding protein
MLTKEPTRLTPAEAQAAIEKFLRLPIELTPVAPLATEPMRLTVQSMSTFYDAVYLALAIREDLKVLTADEPMTRAFAAFDRTIWLGDYS